MLGRDSQIKVDLISYVNNWASPWQGWDLLLPKLALRGLGLSAVMKTDNESSACLSVQEISVSRWSSSVGVDLYRWEIM